MDILSIHDSTQETLCAKLAYTEYMLTKTIQKIDRTSSGAEITALEDLGFANNLIRMRGGFFTGINVKWNTTIPFVPVDTTVNSCGVSIFKFNNHMDYSTFKERMKQIDATLESNGVTNNFNRGNHFIAICEDADGNQYLVLHGSDNRFKYGQSGLYPREDTWYFDKIQTSSYSKGYIRYLIGEAAEKFYSLYLEAERSNSIRNRLVANLILDGCTGIEELVYSPHYGMPDNSSVSIGSQWIQHNNSILLTKEGSPIYLISEENPICQYMPHGFGLTINGDCYKISFSDEEIVINDLRFNCDNGFINTGVTTIRQSEACINSDVLKLFMPLRTITVQKELIQKYSYTRNGIKSFK